MSRQLLRPAQEHAPRRRQGELAESVLLGGRRRGRGHEAGPLYRFAFARPPSVSGWGRPLRLRRCSWRLNARRDTARGEGAGAVRRAVPGCRRGVGRASDRPTAELDPRTHWSPALAFPRAKPPTLLAFAWTSSATCITPFPRGGSRHASALPSTSKRSRPRAPSSASSRDRTSSGGAAESGAPNVEEMEAVRPHLPPTADFLALGKWLKGKIRKGQEPARYFLYRVKTAKATTYSLRADPVPDALRGVAGSTLRAPRHLPGSGERHPSVATARARFRGAPAHACTVVDGVALPAHQELERASA